MVIDKLQKYEFIKNHFILSWLPYLAIALIQRVETWRLFRGFFFFLFLLFDYERKKERTKRKKKGNIRHREYVFEKKQSPKEFRQNK